MNFRVFISSNTKDRKIVDQLNETLLRYGIESLSSLGDMRTLTDGGDSEFARARIYDLSYRIPNETEQKIKSSDCMLTIVSRSGDQTCSVDYETTVATNLGKTVIPIIEEGADIPKSLQGKQCILIDRNQPRLSYERAAQYVNRLRIEKDTKNTIGGLILLGIGFLLVAAIASKD